MKKHLLVDVNSIFHRSYSVLYRRMPHAKDTKGVPCVGTYGFFTTFMRVIKELGSFDGFVFAHDVKGSTEVRTELQGEYKAGRKEKSQHFYQDIHNLVDNYLPMLGVKPIGLRGYEADDIIASACRCHPQAHTYILSGDGDLDQCAKYSENISWIKTQPQWRVMSHSDILNKWGVESENITLIKAITGDSSDNITGIPGYKLLKARKVYKDDKFLSYHEPTLKRNIDVITLRDDLEIHPQPADLSRDNLVKVFTALNSKTLVQRYS